jgi:signal peptidase I
MLDLGRILAGLLVLVLTLVSRNTSGGPVRTFRIPSSSMEPTLRCARPAAGCTAKEDDSIVVKPAHRALRRGDVVVFRAPSNADVRCGEGGTFVERVIGLPGQSVQYDGTTLRVGGAPVREPYVKHPGGAPGIWRVPPAAYFTMGDNRAESCDSRLWGAVPERNVIGVVTQITHH